MADQPRWPKGTPNPGQGEPGPGPGRFRDTTPGAGSAGDWAQQMAGRWRLRLMDQAGEVDRYGFDDDEWDGLLS